MNADPSLTFWQIPEDLRQMGRKKERIPYKSARGFFLILLAVHPPVCYT